MNIGDLFNSGVVRDTDGNLKAYIEPEPKGRARE